MLPTMVPCAWMVDCSASTLDGRTGSWFPETQNNPLTYSIKVLQYHCFQKMVSLRLHRMLRDGPIANFVVQEFMNDL